MKSGFIKFFFVFYSLYFSISFLPVLANGGLGISRDVQTIREEAQKRAFEQATAEARKTTDEQGASFGAPFKTNVVLEFIATTDVPGVTQAQKKLPFLPEYIRRAYLFALSAAGIIAVFQFVRAGFKWMFSEVVTSKQDALDEMKQTTYGLVLLLASVLILNTLGILEPGGALSQASPNNTQGALKKQGAPLPKLEKGDILVDSPFGYLDRPALVKLVAAAGPEKMREIDSGWKKYNSFFQTKPDINSWTPVEQIIYLGLLTDSYKQGIELLQQNGLPVPQNLLSAYDVTSIYLYESFQSESNRIKTGLEKAILDGDQQSADLFKRALENTLYNINNIAEERRRILNK